MVKPELFENADVIFSCPGSLRPLIFIICACSITDFYVLISFPRLRVDAKNDSETITYGRGII